MFGALLILLVLPFTDFSKVRSNDYKPFSKFFLGSFVFNFGILFWIGAQHPEAHYVEIGQLATLFYFS